MRSIDPSSELPRRWALMLALSAWASFASAADWPHWAGENRRGVIDEPSGYDGQGWPLVQLWETSVGDGSTSPIVVAGRLYTLGNFRDRDTLFCLDAATGKKIWTADYPSPPYGRKATGDEGMYRGPSSTPSLDLGSGLLYTLSLDGELRCWNTRDRGEQVWRLNLYDQYDPPRRPKVGRSGQRDYGFTTSPLVHGDWVIVEVGAKDGNLMAFDKRTGQRRWTSENNDPAGHSGALVPMTVEGVPCVAVQTHSHLLVARLDRGREGRTVAAYPWQTEFANSIATPAVHENFVVITSSYNHDTICKLQITLDGAKKVWESPYASGVCSPVIHQGHIYWAWHKVYCLDFVTGKAKWTGPENLSDPGSCIITADDRLIAWCDRGTLLLMETAKRSPQRPTVLARRDNFLHADAWPHLVLAQGRLFCKDRAGNIRCFALGKSGTKAD